jgi:hypothetical protein
MPNQDLLDQLFDSVFTQSNLNINPAYLLLSLITSLVLGLVLASVYKYKNFYSKEFIQTLTILPTLIAVIIFLVNGNLGTSVAVAGTFSLIKFRSPASSAKELVLIFMATAIGLATGMGYLVMAIAVTLTVSLVLVALEHSTFANTSHDRRQLVVSVPKQLSSEAFLTSILEENCKTVDLLGITTKKDKIELTYHADLIVSDQALLQEILSHNAQIDVSITKVAKKKKTL